MRRRLLSSILAPRGHGFGGSHGRLPLLPASPAGRSGHGFARRLALSLAAVIVLAATLPVARAELPFPDDSGGDPYDYTRLRIEDGSCDGVAPGQRVPPGSDLPESFDCRDTFKLSDYAAVPGDDDYDPVQALNPQEFFGVRGPGTNVAWETTTGRPDTVIAVMDSGIRWDEPRPNLVNKYFLNIGELPVPGTDVKGAPYEAYDVNGDGIVNVRDYLDDARVTDLNGNGMIDPQDLIRTFSDGVDDDANGYVDDISGWDFFEGDNDANDDVDYGHGTGESEDAAGEIGIDINPQCPNCMLLEMRVGDSFIADVNHFAEATVYATDNGASVVQSALGTLNNTAFAQDAVDYAYERGVLTVASAADESAGHHNQPSALNRTMTVNSITEGVADVQRPSTFLAFNGCTNFGGYIWVAVASTSCSSDAVGQAAGMAALLYSAGRNAVDEGVIAPDSSGQPLSAEEAKQLFRLAAEDIDFSTPKPPGPPNNFATTLPASQRFVTTEGWDQITGWGRIRSDDLVGLVAAGHIPPEADITSPRWWEPLAATGTVDVVGRVAAPRADSYTYEVRVAPGVQPPRWPLADSWTTVAGGSGTEPTEGVLATLDLADVRAAIDAAPPVYTPLDDPTSRDLPEQDAFRIRVVVHADGDETTPWKTAIAQHQAFARDDTGLLEGWPRFLDGDGAGSAAFADLDGDGLDELVLGDGNGFVHAFKADGTEAPGWPVRTGPIDLPTTGDNGYTRGEVPGTVHAALLTGAPLVADLDGDGRPAVVVADVEGDVHGWDHAGRPLPGFPVRGNPAFTEETACQETRGGDCDDSGPVDVRDELNTPDQAFTSMPSAGDLDPTTPGLEIVAGSNDGHVYAWHTDGSPVEGWPVLLRDPAKVAAVDPVTHRIDYVDGSEARFGRKVLATPALGDLDGDGDLEVVANVNEQYEEEPNRAVRDPSLDVIAQLSPPGNTRVYALHHDGTAHPESPDQAATPHPDDQAYLDGWPVPIAMVVLELLPYVGEGSNGSPVLADIDDDGDLEIGTASIAGPPYVLHHDGSSAYGEGPDGRAFTVGTSLAEFKNPTATDGPSLASLGGGVFGRLAGPDSPFSFAMGSTGLRRLLDVILPEQQLGAEDHISSWNALTGTFDLGFPAQMNDLMFFNTPAIADVTGDGVAEVLQSSATYDLRAYSLGGVPAPGFPKFTGGWSVAAPGLGDLDGDGRLELALSTREGNLFVWRTEGDACQVAEWPQHGHDLHNTNHHGTDARPPGPVTDLVASYADDQLSLSFTGTGDDGPCGAASAYQVVLPNGAVVVVPGGNGPRSATVAAPGLAAGDQLEVRATDDADNRGFPATAQVAVPGAGGPGGPPAGTPAGPPEGTPAGPPEGNPAGPPEGNPAGPPEGDPAGPPEGNPAGPPEGNPAGPSGAGATRGDGAPARTELPRTGGAGPMVAFALVALALGARSAVRRS